MLLSLIIGICLAFVFAAFLKDRRGVISILFFQAVIIGLLLSIFKEYGLYFFIGIIVLSFIYLLLKVPENSVALFIFYVPLLLLFAFIALNYAGVNWVRLGMIIPIVFFLKWLLQRKKPFLQLSVSAVFFAYAVYEFIHFF